MKASSNAVKFIKESEGLRLEAYKDPGDGTLTIGWGHTSGVKEGDRITQAQAERFLQEDIRIVEDELKRQGLALNQNQIDALVSLIFNIGIPQFRTSTILKRIKANPCDPDIRHQFSRWKYAGGKILPGLIRRRKEEADLYFKPTI